MASSLEFVTFVSEQLSDAGNITYKKMFGEYGFYCDEKYFACVCDNQLFVKITESGKKFISRGKGAEREDPGQKVRGMKAAPLLI